MGRNARIIMRKQGAGHSDNADCQNIKQDFVKGGLCSRVHSVMRPCPLDTVDFGACSELPHSGAHVIHAQAC